MMHNSLPVMKRLNTTEFAIFISLMKSVLPMHLSFQNILFCITTNVDRYALFLFWSRMCSHYGKPMRNNSANIGLNLCLWNDCAFGLLKCVFYYFSS